jgi:hypothetical protein
MAGRRFLYHPIKRLDLFARVADFTDGGADIGTYTPTNRTIPAGSMVLATKLKTSGAFFGDTTAIATVGKAGAVDDYFGAAASVFAVGDDYGKPATEAEGLEPTEVTPIITITTATDFTLAVTNGSGVIAATIYYLDLNSKAV